MRCEIAALALLLGIGGAHADDYAVRNAAGATIMLRGKGLPGGQVAPGNVIIDPATGNPYDGSHGQPTAPAIAPVTPVDRGGTITAANIAQQSMAANTSRKGGWITADPNNTGNISVSFTGSATTTSGAGNQAVLTPGATCPLTINGYVVQGAVSVADTVAGDAFTAVEFQ